MNKLLKEARILLAEVLRRGFRPGSETRIESFLGRTAPPIKRAKKAAAARKKAKGYLHWKETARIREAVFARAGGRCELLYSPVERCEAGAEEMDHWLGGIGRRRQQQSVQTCWALCRNHHRGRTEYTGGVGAWNRAFAMHCYRNRYPPIAHIEHAQVARSLRISGQTSAKAEGQTAPKALKAGES